MICAEPRGQCRGDSAGARTAEHGNHYGYDASGDVTYSERYLPSTRAQTSTLSVVLMEYYEETPQSGAGFLQNALAEKGIANFSPILQQPKCCHYHGGASPCNSRTMRWKFRVTRGLGRHDAHVGEAACFRCFGPDCRPTRNRMSMPCAMPLLSKYRTPQLVSPRLC